MIEFLSLLAIWCGDINGFSANKHEVMSCRIRIFNCVMEVEPKVIVHPKYNKLIKKCVEQNTMLRP